MSKREKLIARLLSNPKDFSFEEAEALLNLLSFERSDKGKTSGSRIMFVNRENNLKILLHKPHPRKELLDYQVKQLAETLKQGGLI